MEWVPLVSCRVDNSNLPRTRAEAIQLGVKRYDDGSTCKYGHRSPRYATANGIGGACCECGRLRDHEKKKGVILRTITGAFKPLSITSVGNWVPTQITRVSTFECDNPAPHIFSAEDAREKGLNRYFTGVPCIHGHICERHIHNNECHECLKIKKRKKKTKPYSEWSEKKKETLRASVKRHRKKYPERRKEQERQAAERRRLDPEKNSAFVLKQRKQYNSDTRHMVRDVFKGKIRKGCHQNQMPKWASVDDMALIYTKAREITNETLQQQHVDHIIPMIGIVTDGIDRWPVSGLHVSWNLRIIDALTNMRKRNIITIDEIVALYSQ